MDRGLAGRALEDYTLTEQPILSLEKPHRILSAPNCTFDFLEEGLIDDNAFSQVAKQLT